MTVLTSNLVPEPPVQLNRGERAYLDESLEKYLFTVSRGRHVLVFTGRHCPMVHISAPPTTAPHSMREGNWIKRCPLTSRTEGAEAEELQN